MREIGALEAKNKFGQLLDWVERGEEITIANRGVPVARLVPVPAVGAKRKLGAFTGQITIPEDFDAPLPEELLASFEGQQKRRKNKA